MSWLSKKIFVLSKTELGLLLMLVFILMILVLGAVVYLSRKERSLDLYEVMQTMGFEHHLYQPSYQVYPSYQAVQYSQVPQPRCTQQLAFGNQGPFGQPGSSPLWIV